MKKKIPLLYFVISLLTLQISLFIYSIFFKHPIDLHDTTTPVPDLEIEQSFNHIDTSSSTNSSQSSAPQKSIEQWKKAYFSPWHDEIKTAYSSMQDIQNDSHTLLVSSQQKIKSFFNQKLYRENYRKISDFEKQDLINNLNLEKFQSINQPGITIHTTIIKGAPVDYPLFYNPYKAGEGYPFDSLQYHQLPPSQPIRISHYSKDGLWAYVLTNQNFSGWVLTEHILTLTKKDCLKLYQIEWGVFFKDNIIIRDEKERSLCKSSVGMHLPISKDRNIYFPVKIKKAKEFLKLIKVGVSDQNAFAYHHPTWSIQKAKEILTPLLGKVYGWGTRYGERDCSALVQDYASVFGLWLNRNSKSQSISGSQTFDCSKMSDQQKISLIRDKAIPFKTLFYRPGHIGIFVGFDKYKNPLMLHAVWGFKTKKGQKKGRHIIGKTIISHLNYGQSHPLYDGEEDFLKLMTRITMLDF